MGGAAMTVYGYCRCGDRVERNEYREHVLMCPAHEEDTYATDTLDEGPGTGRTGPVEPAEVDQVRADIMSRPLVPGIKVPMGSHDVTHLDAHYAGWSLTCSCGWQRTAAFPAGLTESIARGEAMGQHANHVRHMALVHDVQTHSDANCGRTCIYPRNRAEVGS